MSEPLVEARGLDALRGRVVGVWGLGAEGHAAVDAARRAGACDVVVFDRRGPAAGAVDGVTVGADLDALTHCDVVIRSPGVHPYDPDARRVAAATEVTTGTALALAELDARAVPVVCVTGTKGKSTTASLLAAILRATARPVALAGNIGVPLLEQAVRTGPGDGTVVVAEISSYQSASVPRFTGHGALSSLFPEHLDWHGDLETYYRDKLTVFRHCPPGAVVVSHQARDLAAGYLDPAVLRLPEEVVGGALLAGFAVPGLLGEHNRRNLDLALATAASVGADVDTHRAPIQRALDDFRGLPHRLQTVAARAGTRYVDDTLSTAPESVVAALRSFGDRDVTLIAGGQDRGVDQAPLVEELRSAPHRVRLVTLPDTGRALSRAVPATDAADLRDAVRVAVETTPAGGVVLLSPGAPSYNAYRNHVELSADFVRLLATHGVTEAPA